MRSARTARPVPRAEPPNLLPTARRAAIPLVLLLLLAGCASGEASDARRGQRQDAAEPATLLERQATFTARAYFPPTATPAPTRSPASTLASLVLTLGLGPGNEPTEEYASVPTDAGTAYAGALLHNLLPGQVVSAAWTNADGAVVASSHYDVTAAADRQWVPLPLYLDGGLPPGEYAVYVFADERPLDSLVFRLLPAGSAPQRLADLPPADQIRIRLGGPNQTPTPGGQSPDQWMPESNGQAQPGWNPQPETGGQGDQWNQGVPSDQSWQGEQPVPGDQGGQAPILPVQTQTP